jgi:outer membrane protein assembly factor BamB
MTSPIQASDNRNSGHFSRGLIPFTALLVLLPASAQQPTAEKPPQLPPPFETIKNSKQFNAVQLGPGNTFSIVQTPPDFHLGEFAISGDGRLLAMGYWSGRIELWDLLSKKRIHEFKSEIGAPGVLKFNPHGDQLIVTGSGGKIVFLELPKGKKLREFAIPLGKNHYDVHELAFDANGKWLAYADEESSKVLDITSDPPRPLADLRDAYSVAVSQDGSELWTVNRSELVAFRTANWESIGHWPLKSEPMGTSRPTVRTGVTADGKATVAVPSSQGLVIYSEPDMSGTFVTNKQTNAVGFAMPSHIYVSLAKEITFLDTAGSVVCKRSYGGRVGEAVSEDGRWLALSQFNSVDLWRMDDLVRDCEGGR